ncbi:uncharacterized protein ACHE_20784S [Aspergillus chevalieri]|uniref:C2H2-type domain-containing protein n=1 Tax=Aspergillus chevalieri TaxID=182096 RepID=A0A7R7ZLE7_ASPCH|nr:uncharacterized protein ACHE_20784S [Aspergillus chevalieri]BCR85326.1 hypothetical protein ACHE_20784S [Aspergillus chevalieri]
MAESRPPGEEDTFYFADNLEQNVNFTLDPNLLDYPSIESQFLDLSALDSLRSVEKPDHSALPSVPAGYDSNISLPLPFDAADGNKTPGQSNQDFTDVSSHYDFFPGLLPDYVTADSTVNSEPTPCAQESERAGPGAEPAELRHATIPNNYQLPASDFTGLPRRRSRYFVRRLGPDPDPVFVPNSCALDPMDRWHESPPEDEPASMAAIMDAVRNAPSRDYSRLGDRGAISNAFRHYRRAPSTSSGESNGSSRVSGSSGVSNSSRGLWTGLSHHSQSRVNKPTRRPQRATDKPRIFCCTFCCDTFKSKYDWARHEKSLHLNPEAWYCAPHGSTVFSIVTGRKHCAFCSALDPSPEHLEFHSHNSCRDDSNKPRSFRRKDHLVQHLRLFHRLEAMPLLDDWKIGESAVSSRCGFCEHLMNNWDERVDHIAEHFRKGSTMRDWRGEHGFPPEIAERVTNALPPYLIGSESQSMIPFSATNVHVRDHFAQISSRANWNEEGNRSANCEKTQVAAPAETPNDSISRSELSSFTEILTLHLSHYAQRQMTSGVIPTDEMFQQEARRVLYDSEDSWNQTIADNPEWLSAFRNLHCG